MKRTIVFLAAVAACGFAVAQEAASGAVPGSGMSIRQAWEYGGWIMWVLAAVSVFALALVLYFLVSLRTGALVPVALRTDLLSSIRAGDLSEARRLCERRPCALSEIALTGLDTLRDAPDCDASLLRDAIEGEGARQAESIQGQTEFLLDIATVAPLLGLLGTVLGMLTAFGSLASDVAAAKPVVLASGVSQAIITTIFGLFVAIPSMVFYAWFRRRAARQISLLEGVASEIVTALLGKGMGAKTL